MKEIIAFVGRAGSGKDYQCTLLEKQGFKKFAFADALRRIAFLTLGIDYEYGMQHYEELKANEVINGLNLRQILERLGTQGIRYYQDDFWVTALLTSITKSDETKICISDLRFPNEFYSLNNFCRENNYKFKCIFCDYRSDRYQEHNEHISAQLSNRLVENGYKDLQILTEEDILKVSQ